MQLSGVILRREDGEGVTKAGKVRDAAQVQVLSGRAKQTSKSSNDLYAVSGFHQTTC